MVHASLPVVVAAATAVVLTAVCSRWLAARRAASRHLRWVRAIRFETYAEEMDVAVGLALACGAAMRSTIGARAQLKDGEHGIDPVTATDEANEALVTSTLLRRFPGHAIIGEEAAAAAGRVPPIGAGPTWIVDPIDGTQNFVAGLPLSAVSIGLCVRGVPALGVVYEPYTDSLYVGVAAEGAYLNGRRLRADPCVTLDKAMVLTDVGYERSERGVRRMGAGASAVLGANAFGLRFLGSSVLCAVYVAAGQASAFYMGFAQKDRPKPWDWCAAYAIGVAAGVTFLRLESDAPFDITSGSIVCAGTPQLAQALLALVRPAAELA